ncbi:hypothetical protein RhiJN_01762 [Ceratobasidium sp. AG-Ba]|nr:hypothetical protein RhiJN_01762 [Ceratobasidium sp. AG-Ba]QRW02691.1 hypothetical protein RhiLY_01690 [Ceratobasidium sp. AG-Ba]
MLLLNLTCLVLLSCGFAWAAVLGSKTRIPAISPGLPDIIQTTFTLARPSNISTKIQVDASASTISITNQPCTTTCSGAAGTGPNQLDCTTIANSLRSGGQGGKNVTLSPLLGTQFAFRSCKVVVTNQDTGASVV